MLDKMFSMFMMKFGKKGKVISFVDLNGQYCMLSKKKMNVKKKIYYSYLDLKVLMNGLMTLMMFLMLWKLNIEIMKENFLWENQKILYIFFMCYFMLSSVNYLDEILKMMNLLMNSLMLVFLLDLTLIDVFKYNMFMFLSYYMMFMVYSYCYALNWGFTCNFVYDFLMYPWLLMLMVYVLMYFEKEEYFKYFEYLDYFMMMKEYSMEEFEDMIESWC